MALKQQTNKKNVAFYKIYKVFTLIVLLKHVLFEL